MNFNLKILIGVFLTVATTSIANAQNAFFRGLLGADNQECRNLYNPQTPGYANLAAYWKMDGAVGVISNGATLASGITGGPTASVTSSGSLSYGTGIIAQGVTANGTSADVISAGTPAALNDLPAATWMMWVKVTTGSAIKLFYKSDSNGSSGYFFLLDTDNKLKFAKVAKSTNMQKFTASLANSYFSNSWHQVVVTWDGSTNSSGVRIYSDGRELIYNASDSRFDTSSGDTSYAQNGSGGWNLDAAYPFLLAGNPAGSSSNPSAGAFAGTMDEFAVWNRVLTPTEITRLYRHQKCN